nr:hypothetical protein [Streptomyces sp. SID13666]
MLLAAYQHTFGRDLEAMSRHLIDDVAVGWDELGTDLLDGAPPALITALTGGEQWPSRTLDHLITPDGSPPVRMTVTEDTADEQDMQWGYLLHRHGIEVINILSSKAGPVVGWDTDPCLAFSDHPGHWPPPATTPITESAPALRPARSAPAPAPAQPRTAARR